MIRSTLCTPVRPSSLHTHRGFATAMLATLFIGLCAGLPAKAVAGSGSAGTAAAEAAPASVASARRVAVELTFLKSLPGERDRLVRFIEANWFEMDSIAAERGLMGEYRVLETGTDEGPWNVLVEVTYRDERGYAGIAPAFEEIRAAHQTVLIDGKGLRALGTIVESRQTFVTLPAVDG